MKPAGSCEAGPLPPSLRRRASAGSPLQAASWLRSGPCARSETEASLPPRLPGASAVCPRRFSQQALAEDEVALCAVPLHGRPPPRVALRRGLDPRSRARPGGTSARANPSRATIPPEAPVSTGGSGFGLLSAGLVQHEVRHLQPRAGRVAVQEDRERAAAGTAALTNTFPFCWAVATTMLAAVTPARATVFETVPEAMATVPLRLNCLAVHLQRKPVRTVPAQAGSRWARAVHADPRARRASPHADPLGAGAVALSTHGGRVRPRRSGLIRPKTPTAPSEVELLAPWMPGRCRLWRRGRPTARAGRRRSGYEGAVLPPVAYRPQPTVPGASKNPP